MNLLIVSATVGEISFLFSDKSSHIVEGSLLSLSYNNFLFDVLITGVGMTASTYHLTKALLQKKYDCVLNVGLAGSFNKNIQKGSIVNVVEDSFSELGAEDDNEFRSIIDLGLENKNKHPFIDGKLNSSYDFSLDCLKKLPMVKSITVNTVHGNEDRINEIIQRLHPDIETMEGAAVLFVCGNEKINCLQIRGISNFVEKRNKANWDIKLALNNLKNFIEEFLIEFDQI